MPTPVTLSIPLPAITDRTHNNYLVRVCFQRDTMVTVLSANDSAGNVYVISGRAPGRKFACTAVNAQTAAQFRLTYTGGNGAAELDLCDMEAMAVAPGSYNFAPKCWLP
jgi:hypothetical protein